MANAWVAEYTGTLLINGVPQPLPNGAPIRVQKVAFTGTAGTIAEQVSEHCGLVRLWVDTNACYLASEAGTSATTSDVPIAAGQPEFYSVMGNTNPKFSFIAI
jgi:hypothetical protein